jgi:orotate phosphoribosyltransferase-like protein
MSRRIKWDLDRAIELLKKGHTCRQVADILGIKREQVYDAFRNRNLSIVRDKRGFKASWDMDRAKELADQGHAIFEIAKIMGLPQDLVRSGFKNRGWKPMYTRSGRHVTWDVEKAKKLRKQGLKWVDIDRDMNLTPGTVRHYFVRKGLHQPRCQPNMKWDIAEARKMRQQGMGWREIGEKVGTGGNNVRRAFARRGWLAAGKRQRINRKIPRIRLPLRAFLSKTK